ncbi:727_t:CDS:2, partial [Racocetra fulgida]
GKKDGKSEQAYIDEINAIKDAEADVMAEFFALKNDEQIIQSDKDYSINTSAVTSDNLT